MTEEEGRLLQHNRSPTVEQKLRRHWNGKAKPANEESCDRRSKLGANLVEIREEGWNGGVNKDGKRRPWGLRKRKRVIEEGKTREGGVEVGSS